MDTTGSRPGAPSTPTTAAQYAYNAAYTSTQPQAETTQTGTQPYQPYDYSNYYYNQGYAAPPSSAAAVATSAAGSSQNYSQYGSQQWGGYQQTYQQPATQGQYPQQTSQQQTASYSYPSYSAGSQDPAQAASSGSASSQYAANAGYHNNTGSGTNYGYTPPASTTPQANYYGYYGQTTASNPAPTTTPSYDYGSQQPAQYGTNATTGSGRSWYEISSTSGSAALQQNPYAQAPKYSAVDRVNKPPPPPPPPSSSSSTTSFAAPNRYQSLPHPPTSSSTYGPSSTTGSSYGPQHPPPPPPPATTAPPTSYSPASARKLPPSFQRFLERVLATPTHKKEAVTYASNLIKRMQGSDALHTTNWEEFPVPDFSAVEVTEAPQHFKSQSGDKNPFNNKNSSKLDRKQYLFNNPNVALGENKDSSSSSSSSSSSKKDKKSKKRNNRLPFSQSGSLGIGDGRDGDKRIEGGRGSDRNDYNSTSGASFIPLSASDEGPRGGKGSKKRKRAFGNAEDNSDLDTISRQNPNKQQYPDNSKSNSRPNRLFQKTSFQPTSYSSSSSSSSIPLSAEELQRLQETLVGRSEVIEKAYLRLTALPNPDDVRPEHILKLSLQNVKNKARDGADYVNYLCDQLKAIRQDLTIQKIKNDFAIDIYETHARLALENKDLHEYSQCQNKLFELYDEGLSSPSQTEFTAYRILYTIYTEKTEETKLILQRLTSAILSDQWVSMALKIHHSIILGNYSLFFELFREAPVAFKNLIECFIEKIRIAAIRVIIGSFRPSVLVTSLTTLLSFSSESECTEFLTKRKITAQMSEGKLVVFTTKSQSQA